MVGCLLFSTKNMAVKVLVTQIGQQIVSETKQVENKETGDIVGYWLTQPRVVNYTKDEEGNIGVNFTPYCLVSDEAEFSVRAEHIVAILEPRKDVAEGWNALVYPQTEETSDEEVSAAVEEAVAEEASDAELEGREAEYVDTAAAAA